MSDATATTTSSFDPARAEAFGERMVGVLNDAYLALLTPIIHAAVDADD